MYNGFCFDSFFELPEQALPRNCEYYFNVLFISVGLPVGELERITGVEGLWEINDLSRIKDPRPICTYFYESEDAHTWNIEATPHTVVEVNTKSNEVCWYDMLDFETKSPWAIDPIEEDFNYDDEDNDDEDF